MKSQLIGFIFTCIINFSAFAQQSYSVKGTVSDTASNNQMQNTSISILNEKDSTLVSFTRAGEAGSFAIDKLTKGRFILLITYPGYADYIDNFSLDSVKKTIDFGQIKMILKAKLLADVIVKAKRIPIRIKGDTTEYNAENFKIQPNAKVEDLLKQLPGIQVDKDGKITAQGETVSKVLVDGEEFFGDDPTLVTKNLRADMVDKVQLYDKKSDQATFTGIDDGKKDKTINIKLKADKKNGYFGKAEAGIATDKYYQGQLLFNKFKKQQKFSAYGTLANTGQTGLGWQDAQKYGSSDNVEFGDGFFQINNSNDELESFDGRYNGQGIPSTKSGGLHYDSKWKGDKESLNANYKAGSLGVDGSSDTKVQNNLPTGIINTNSDHSFINSMFRQKLNGIYQIKLDTSSNLKISLDGTFKNSTTYDNDTSTSFKNNQLLNSNHRTVNNKVNTETINASAFYTKKFKKTGRTLSLRISEASDQSNANGTLLSNTTFYDSTGKTNSSQTQHIDQYKTNLNKSTVFQSDLTYTEPLSKYYTLAFNYDLGLNSGKSDRKSLNASSPGKYDVKVDSLSNVYHLDQTSNQVGTYLNFKKKKFTFNFGTKVSEVSFNQVNESPGIELKRKFINWNPGASFQYRFSQQRAIRFNYSGNSEQPRIEQIQPIIVNTDPLNLTIGNPSLRPSFKNNFNFNYHSYKVISGQYIGIYGNYSVTSNPIVDNRTTDSFGKSTNQFLNLSNEQISNYYIGAYFGAKLKKADMQIGFDFNLGGDNSYNLVNQKLNLTKSSNYSISLNVSKYKEKKYDFSLSLGPNYYISGSSLQPETNNNGTGFNSNASFTIYLPAKFQIHGDGSFEYKTKTKTFNQDFHRTLINASISRTFFKADNLKFSLSGNDLLNQNKGFNRSANGNIIYQNTYTTIQRYFMFSIIWDFNKAGGK